MMVLSPIKIRCGMATPTLRKLGHYFTSTPCAQIGTLTAASRQKYINGWVLG